VALEATFHALDDRLTAVREAFTDLRVALQEDSPRQGAPLLVDQLGDAATDLLGWLEEAAEAGAEALRQAGRPRDLDGWKEITDLRIAPQRPTRRYEMATQDETQSLYDRIAALRETVTNRLSSSLVQNPQLADVLEAHP